jgi:hypothetical protein
VALTVSVEGFDGGAAQLQSLRVSRPLDSRVSAVYTSSAGILQVSGCAPAAVYAEILRSVVYRRAPIPGGTQGLVVQVFDGAAVTTAQALVVFVS